MFENNKFGLSESSLKLKFDFYTLGCDPMVDSVFKLCALAREDIIKMLSCSIRF